MIWIVILLENEVHAQKVPSGGNGTLLCRAPLGDSLFRLYWLRHQLGFPRNMSKLSLASSTFNCWHHTAKEKALTWTTTPVDTSQKHQISIRQSKGTFSIVSQSKLYGSEPKRTCVARRSAREVLIFRPIGHRLRMQIHTYFRSPQKSLMLASSHTEVCLYEQLL